MHNLHCLWDSQSKIKTFKKKVSPEEGLEPSTLRFTNIKVSRASQLCHPGSIIEKQFVIK